MKDRVAALLSILLFATSPLLAQSQDSNSKGKPGTSDAVVPSNSTADKKKPKKVWTNDELPKTGDGVSVVGEPGADTSDADKTSDSASATLDPRQRQIDDYKKPLSSLQSQINSIDKRLEQLKNFKAENGSPSGGLYINKGYDMVPIPDQIKLLEEKKKQLRAKMDDIETDAHKNGVTADDLR